MDAGRNAGSIRVTSERGAGKNGAGVREVNPAQLAIAAMAMAAVSLEATADPHDSMDDFNNEAKSCSIFRVSNPSGETSKLTVQGIWRPIRLASTEKRSLPDSGHCSITTDPYQTPSRTHISKSPKCSLNREVSI